MFLRALNILTSIIRSDTHLFHRTYNLGYVRLWTFDVFSCATRVPSIFALSNFWY